ncbi:MAG: hypothetical protein JNN33_04200, partial [Rhodospirillaceae bacterium]|nr:hypothetical protein [Rhodospirillaceae bacterium]
KWGKVNATIPKGIEPSSLTLDQAVSLISERAAKMGGSKARKAPKAKAAPPKSKGAAKKAAKEKPAKEAAAEAPKPAKKVAKKTAKKTAK